MLPDACTIQVDLPKSLILLECRIYLSLDRCQSYVIPNTCTISLNGMALAIGPIMHDVAEKMLADGKSLAEVYALIAQLASTLPVDSDSETTDSDSATIAPKGK